MEGAFRANNLTKKHYLKQELRHINLQRSQLVPLVISRMVAVFIMKQRTAATQYGNAIILMMIEYLKTRKR